MSAENFGLKRFVFSRFVGALCDQFYCLPFLWPFSRPPDRLRFHPWPL